MDSTTIQLVANCMGWAKHRRRKAAAKCHLRLNLQSFLPQCAIVDTAKHHDSTKARDLCAGLKSGEIAVFDKAYTKFKHLFELTERGIWWVGRAKDNMQYYVVRTLETTAHKRILRDEVIEMALENSKEAYPCELRRVVALVEVNGQDVEMVFMTNNLDRNRPNGTDYRNLNKHGRSHSVGAPYGMTVNIFSFIPASCVIFFTPNVTGPDAP